MHKLQKIGEYGKELTLLYVEDDKDVRDITASLLESLFGKVVVGVDGADGYEKFSLDKFDLIISDVQMPKLNGLEMIAKIRKTDLDIPILVLSAFNESSFLMDSIKLGVEGYILKPLDIKQFTEVLEKTISRIIITLQMQKKTKDLEIANKKIEIIYKHLRDSINYASIIQGAVVSQESEIKPFFKDSFVHWLPKDTVGGDIWLFNELRHEDECLLMFIDCTGHGVPGAFVTMIVKAVEREIIVSLKKHTEFDISPAVIMANFNKTMKLLLKQETKDSISNAGWDGGIIYYNRSTQILKFAGAETPLFYTTTDGELKTVKGNRYSVGYKKCSMDYEYKETILEVEEGMKFYCTTDGYLDQNGGAKDFPFGKRRFANIIKENHTKTMANQKEIFIDEMTKYEAFIENNDRNDDMTVIGFEIGAKSSDKKTVS